MSATRYDEMKKRQWNRAKASSLRACADADQNGNTIRSNLYWSLYEQSDELLKSIEVNSRNAVVASLRAMASSTQMVRS